MKQLFFIGCCLIALAAQGQVTFTGTSHDVITITPAASTGLHAIYVLYDATGVSMSYNAGSDSYVNWMRYGEQGGGYAEDITSGITRSGRASTLTVVEPEQGYIIEEGTTRTYVWVTDYSRHRLQLNGLITDTDRDCGTATLLVDGDGDDIPYYSITGVRQILDRQIALTYNTLEWDDEATQWVETEATENIAAFKTTIAVPAPLENTVFTMTGDRFLTTWGEAVSTESDTYQTAAVDVRTTAVQEERENDNEKTTGTEGLLGGSAPAVITFTAYPTDAVVFKEWQMSTDSEFENIDLRLNQEETTQTFNEAGTYYWRFVAANNDGTCEAYGDTYTVNIGESELVCPNVFSPGSTPGINDVWKVSYKSIIDFECWIFNRWGKQIAHFTDPSQGWDGYYRGKLVSAGVYYYVIQASGSDGQKYKLSGDINIIRYKQNPNATIPGTETEDDATDGSEEIGDGQ